MKVKGQLEQAQLENLTSDPSNLPDGKLWLRTDTDRAKFFDGATTQTVVTEAQTQVLTNKELDASLVTAGGVVVGTTATQTLTNKTLDASVVTAGGVVVGTTATQTLTNKTLTTPAITSPTGLVKADVGLSAVDNTSDATKNSATATLTNKTLTTPVISSPTGIVKADVGLSNVDNTSNATERAAAATLTNKTIGDSLLLTEITTPSTPAAGLKKLYPKTDGKMYTLDSTGAEALVGSGGSGGSGINYILNPDAETNLTGWATYADAAGALPVDGTGGTANSTLARQTTSPLRGTACFEWTKFGAASRQGEGFSYDFTIDLADSLNPKMMQISFDHLMNGGTYDSGTSTTNSDLIAYIYNKSTSTLIEPAGMKIQQGMPFKATFQPSYSSSGSKQQYRLIIHQSLAGTSAYSMQFDNFYVGPQVTATGYAASDWKTYPMIITSSGTSPTKGTISVDKAMWRQVGDSVEIRYDYQQTAAGSAGTGGYRFSLPPGLVADSSKVNIIASSIPNLIGTGSAFNGTTVSWGYVALTSTTYMELNVGDQAAALNPVGAATHSLSNTAVRYSFTATIPILGWSSNTVASSDTSTTVVSAKYQIPVSTAATANLPVNFSVLVKDSNGAVTTGASWKYTVKVPGDYLVAANLNMNGGSYYRIYKNGTSYQYFMQGNTNYIASGSILLTNLVVGDYFDIRPDTGATTQSVSSIEVFRLSGPVQITTTETVSCRYTNTAATAIGTGPTLVPFATKSFDTHGAFVTNTLTVPVAGLIDVSVGLTVGAVNLSTAQAFIVYLYKNGALYSYLGISRGNGVSNTHYVRASDSVSCIAGDTLTIYASSDVASSLSISAGLNFVNFKRVGN